MIPDGSIGSIASLSLSIALVSAACARDGSEAIDAELQRLDGRIGEGIAKIERALVDPTLASPELGEGIRMVERSARALAALEVDDRASDLQQLMAIVYQARAWDDVVVTFATTPLPTLLDANERVLLGAVLGEKAYPARAAAESSYLWALEHACRTGLENASVMFEIVDGLQRYRRDVSSVALGREGVAVASDRPCDDLE